MKKTASEARQALDVTAAIRGTVENLFAGEAMGDRTEEAEAIMQRCLELSHQQGEEIYERMVAREKVVGECLVEAVGVIGAMAEVSAMEVWGGDAV